MREVYADEIARTKEDEEWVDRKLAHAKGAADGDGEALTKAVLVNGAAGGQAPGRQVVPSDGSGGVLSDMMP